MSKIIYIPERFPFWPPRFLRPSPAKTLSCKLPLEQNRAVQVHILKEHSIFISLKQGKSQSEIRACPGKATKNVFQAANSFKMDLYYCLVVKKRKKKEKNKSAILQTAVGLH